MAFLNVSVVKAGLSSERIGIEVTLRSIGRDPALIRGRCSTSAHAISTQFPRRLKDIATDTTDPADFSGYGTQYRLSIGSIPNAFAVVTCSGSATATVGAPGGKSDDGGLTWRKVNQLLWPSGISSLPNDQKIAFDAQGEATSLLLASPRPSVIAVISSARQAFAIAETTPGRNTATISRNWIWTPPRPALLQSGGCSRRFLSFAGVRQRSSCAQTTGVCADRRNQVGNNPSQLRAPRFPLTDLRSSSTKQGRRKPPDPNFEFSRFACIGPTMVAGPGTHCRATCRCTVRHKCRPGLPPLGAPDPS